MDLKQFCGTEESRPYIMAPFSIGQWTYATNGHICVRIPRLPDVAEPTEPKILKAEKLFEEMPADGYAPLPSIALEADEDDACDECDGRGYEHDCPGCLCTCDACNGTGHPLPGHKTTVGIGDAIFNGRYIFQLLKLPNVVMTTPCMQPGTGSGKAAFFRFDGGEGCLMEMLGKNSRHIETSEKAA